MWRSGAVVAQSRLKSGSRRREMTSTGFHCDEHSVLSGNGHCLTLPYATCKVPYCRNSLPPNIALACFSFTLYIHTSCQSVALSCSCLSRHSSLPPSEDSSPFYLPHSQVDLVYPAHSRYSYLISFLHTWPAHCCVAGALRRRDEQTPLSRR